MKGEIAITRADFNAAIETVMQRSMEDPHFEGHPEARMIYSMGGAVFAKEVMWVLFGDKEEDKTDE